ncbi:MAG: hypothetical protein CMN21_06750 [Rubinisphaera sp.]|nr:hypothetical protein [Rubinisphaera sp.]|tara:strand:- start:8714 stop:8917 length:204 start_codon:yes stop_codon:yes gene_type:complete
MPTLAVGMILLACVSKFSLKFYLIHYGTSLAKRNYFQVAPASIACSNKFEDGTQLIKKAHIVWDVGF